MSAMPVDPRPLSLPARLLAVLSRAAEAVVLLPFFVVALVLCRWSPDPP